MNTKLKALAAAAALCAGSHALAQAQAQAQAQTPAQAQTAPEDGVTIYGRAWGEVQSVKTTGPGTTQPSRIRLFDQSSRIGFKGSKTIGPDLRAWFQFETAFTLDDVSAASDFAGRNTGVGLDGRFGTFLLGRWDSPFKDSQVSIVDPFGDLALADITANAVRQGGFSQRLRNTIRYDTPEFNGLQGAIAFVPNEARTATVNPKIYSGSVTYNKGPLYVGLAAEAHRDAIAQTPTAGVNENGVGLAAKYKFATFDVRGQVGRYTRTGTDDQKSWSLGTVWNVVGGHKLLARIGQSEGGGATGPLAQPKCNAYGVGYRYDYDKETFLVANMAKIDNKTGNLCIFGSGALPVTNGQASQGVSIGIARAF